MSLFNENKENIPQVTQQNIKGNYIKNLKVGAKINNLFKILSINKKTKKDGNAFLALEVMDKTGKMPAKVWDNAEYYFKMLRQGEIYEIIGYVNEFMSQKEIKVDGIKTITESDKTVNRSDFIEKAPFDNESLFTEMSNFLFTHLKNPHLLKLVELFIQEYQEKFKMHYGALKVHHAYIGGLLQHTHSMLQLANYCAQHYKLDKELLLIGVLFHDVGKMFEFSVSPTLDITKEGGLLGHIIISNNIFLELIRRISDFPEELSQKIQHLIISHHGEKEFGSPEVPKIPEAFVLNILDLMDSKLKIVEETLAKSENNNLFSEYVKVLNRRLFLEPKDQ